MVPQSANVRIPKSLSSTSLSSLLSANADDGGDGLSASNHELQSQRRRSNTYTEDKRQSRSDGVVRPSSFTSSGSKSMPSKSESVRIRTGRVRRLSTEGNLNKVSITNWAETVEASIEQFRYPETVEDVVKLVSTHGKIRCAGALHSCAPLIASEGIIMSLTRMDKILDIDAETSVVRVQSGVRIHDLCDALAPHGLAVGTLGTIDWQTLSGAVMTGTHGGGLSIPSLHDFVRSYTLVTSDGEVRKVRKAEEPDLFQAM